MKEWKEFLENLNHYEKNVGIQDLLHIIESVSNSEPKQTLYMGTDWLFFTSEDSNTCLKFNPKSKKIETICKRTMENGNEEVKRVEYAISFVFDMVLKKETVVNHFVRVKGGFQTLVEASKTVERYTKLGFQKAVKSVYYYSPLFLFINMQQRERNDLFVPKDFSKNHRERELRNFEFKEVNRHYYLSGIGNNLLINLDEVRDYVVCFLNENGERVNFPLFFNDDKSIMWESFVHNTLLQVPVDNPCGFDEDGISFEGHDRNSAKVYMEQRNLLAKKVLENNYATELNNSLRGVQILEYKH